MEVAVGQEICDSRIVVKVSPLRRPLGYHHGLVVSKDSLHHDLDRDLDRCDVCLGDIVGRGSASEGHVNPSLAYSDVECFFCK